MASFHSRSNSFPSQSNPVMEDVQDQLCRLTSSQNTSTSSLSSICANLASLTNLHEGVNNLIEMPSAQQALSKEGGENWMNGLLEESVRLIDLCEFARDAVCSTKESVRVLECSIRRSRGETDRINAYVASRKKINKMVKKSIRNMKSSSAPVALPARDGDIKAILKEAESIDFSVVKSVLVLLCGEKERSTQRSWSFLSKLMTQTNRVHSDDEEQELYVLNIDKSLQKSMDIKMLKSTEMMMQELEEGLESLLRSVVKTRVSLLNILSH